MKVKYSLAKRKDGVCFNGLIIPFWKAIGKTERLMDWYVYKS
jgi:hypothetical protein